MDRLTELGVAFLLNKFGLCANLERMVSLIKDMLGTRQLSSECLSRGLCSGESNV